MASRFRGLGPATPGDIPSGMTVSQSGDMMMLEATSPRWAYLWKQIPGILMLLSIGWMFVMTSAPDRISWAIIGTVVVVAFCVGQLLVKPDNTRLTVSTGAVSWTERTWTGTSSRSCAPPDFRIGRIVVPTGKWATMPTWLLLHFGETDVGAFSGWEKPQLELVVAMLESWVRTAMSSTDQKDKARNNS